MSDQSWTIGRLLTWTADYLRERGAESPRLDAEVLLAHARSCERIDLYAEYETPAGDELRERFRGLVRQRAAGMPVAYLAGRREFFSLSFAVNSHVLIPRPETEQLVVRALDAAKQRGGQPLEIADIGTGSGILAICLAKQLPAARVVAVDLSGAALEVAAENVRLHRVEDRVRLIESDLFNALGAEEQFDIVVSNPPYVKTEELAGLAEGVRKYEPRVALDGGVDGTRVYEPLVSQLPDRLRPGGWFFGEIGPAVRDRVVQLLDARPGLCLGPVLNDLAGLPRIVQAQREGPA